MKPLLLATALLLTVVSRSQTAATIVPTQKHIAEFIITEAKISDRDFTQQYIDKGGMIAFYVVDDKLCMANVLTKVGSQSFGPLVSVSSKKESETYHTWSSQTFSFYWHFRNSYDDNSGVAAVEFSKVYKPNGTVFICSITPPNQESVMYIGYMKGSLNFDKF